MKRILNRSCCVWEASVYYNLNYQVVNRVNKTKYYFHYLSPLRKLRCSDTWKNSQDLSLIECLIIAFMQIFQLQTWAAIYCGVWKRLQGNYPFHRGESNWEVAIWDHRVESKVSRESRLFLMHFTTFTSGYFLVDLALLLYKWTKIEKH